MSKTAPYGTWASPISPDTITSKTITFDDVLVDPITKTIYHLEERPDDNGRCVIVDTTAKKDVLPSPYSARTFVQEYGGAPAIVYNNIIYFSNDTGNASNRDNKIYALDLTDGSLPKAITPDNYLLRYANFAIHPTQTNLLVTLREDHTNDPNYTAPENVVNTICVVDINTATVNIVVQGADFYATPVFNPSGTKIGWQQWNLPDMPWQGGLVYVTDVSVDSGSLTVSSDLILVAGEAGTKSATFPSWITDTSLAYITDGYNKYWNPYIFDTNTQQSTVVLKTSLEQDFAEPAWFLGLYPYAILDGGKYGAFTAFKDGGNILYIVDLSAPSDPVQIKNFDYTVAQHVRAVTENTFVFTASKTAAPGGVILGTVLSGSYAVEFDTLKASADDDPDMDKYISPPIPKDVAIPGGHPIHVVYYAPHNPDYSGPSDPDEKPPCVLNVHGGPTGLEPQALNWTKMFFTSRGFAWLDVNYRGSSGYGREYIDLLNSNWGIYDTQDCQQAAAAMATRSYIDGKRVAIRGGSAGAYTTLSSVTFASDPTFYKNACGAYGCVTDVETLTKSTEKFESQYIYSLFGSLPDNGAWDARNPIKNVAKLSVPLLILQGLADGVVPPSIVRDFLSQSAEVAPSEEFAFYPNEGHHWHQASTIKDALLREFAWYQKNLL
ncbi:Alpha/Beta hydrolase protein [Boletus edulis BED1]|uniref:Alpha/Beta hydrolase protein n=1 Tax=Boletus edulis BED1 TaxID=1328754 RepID=A0AAD4GAW1_BOLED|nr:Alpha/Beta hydrolase protein [Boletus edulis BED1]